MSATFLSVLLFVGQAMISIIGWWVVASRQNNKETAKRIESLEKYNKRVIGWVLGKFGVDLNGDA